MTVYEKQNGDRVTLSVSTQKEWADHIKDWFIRLGCSEGYAEKVARGYRSARAL